MVVESDTIAVAAGDLAPVDVFPAQHDVAAGRDGKALACVHAAEMEVDSMRPGLAVVGPAQALLRPLGNLPQYGLGPGAGGAVLGEAGRIVRAGDVDALLGEPDGALFGQ